MNALNFYRYLKSYLTIHISGGFSERFINLCNRNRITLWDITYENETVTANIYSRDFVALKSIRRKSGVKLKILSKNGLRFDLVKHKKRRGLFFGAVFAAAFMIVMNMFVWEIETVGSVKLSRSEILSTVKKIGLDYGTFVPLFNGNEASRDALSLFNGEVLWLAINIKGSKATIEVRDLEKPSDKNIKSEPSNLIANFDGILIRAQTNSGVQVAEAGEAVTKGSILISGIFENEDGTVMYQRSDGCFTALNQRSLHREFVKELSCAGFTSVQRYRKLIFFHLKAPLYFRMKNNFDEQYYTRQISFNEKVLPLGMTEGAMYKTDTEKVNNVTNLYYIDKFSNEEYEKMKNTLIISADYSLVDSDNKLNISCDYECIDYIGEEVPIINENLIF